MIVEDRVYGRCVIAEPVMLRLISSAPMQRLVNINQAGAAKLVIAGKDVNRLEHSIGVMLLLRMLGASCAEQVAGLLHDVPHTAFSHVADSVFKSKDHDFHELYHRKMIMRSEIPGILAEFGMSAEDMIKPENFPLVEKDIPDLCADRIDYMLRDMVAIGRNTENNSRAAMHLSHLIVRDREIIADSPDAALALAKDYLMMDSHAWSEPYDRTINQILAKAISIALEKNIISKEDLFSDDNSLYDMLLRCGDDDISKLIRMLNPSLKIVLTADPQDSDFSEKNKLRYIDPKFPGDDGRLTRVSERYPDFARMLSIHKARPLMVHSRVVSF